MTPMTGLLCLLPFAVIVASRALPEGTDDAPAPFEAIQHTGKIVAWQIAADGSVAMQVENREKTPATSPWFRSPADKTDSTRFEELMLEAVLRLAASKEAVTVVYDADKERAGKTLEDAFPVASLLWGASIAQIKPADAK